MLKIEGKFKNYSINDFGINIETTDKGIYTIDLICENYGKCDIFIESNALLNCELCSGGDIVGVKTISIEDIVRNESDSDLTFPGLKKKVEKLEKNENNFYGIEKVILIINVLKEEKLYKLAFAIISPENKGYSIQFVVTNNLLNKNLQLF